MVFISEWLPNPSGPDAAGEFIELYNGGAAPAALDGWVIKTEKGKTFSLGGRTIGARGFLVLKKDVTKLTLRNTDGGLSLYAPGGALADRAAFVGAAPEGKSFSRADYGTGPATHFTWAAPTPGAANIMLTAAFATSGDRYGIALNPQFTSADFFAIMVGTAALVAALIRYVITRHEDLSKLFATRNGGIWGTAREGSGRGDREAQPRFR